MRISLIRRCSEGIVKLGKVVVSIGTIETTPAEVDPGFADL